MKILKNVWSLTFSYGS